jgi:hypothetical protein
MAEKKLAAHIISIDDKTMAAMLEEWRKQEAAMPNAHGVIVGRLADEAQSILDRLRGLVTEWQTNRPANIARAYYTELEAIIGKVEE